jgi:hypothetical protein
VDGSPKIIETLDHHLITGSAREEVDGEKGDYVDKCDNHLLLADAYSGLAEHLVLGTVASEPVDFESLGRGEDELSGKGTRYAG